MKQSSTGSYQRCMLQCRVADGKVSMNEAHEMHAKLLRRQHFGRDPPSYDPSQF